MSTLRPLDRVSLCRFTFADGRKCRTPRAGDHPHFCHYHARKETQARVAEKLGNDLAYFFSGEYLSACDLTTAIGRLIPAVVRGDLKPKAAATVAYLSQTLAQALHLAQHEYTNAFGFPAWREAVRDGVHQNYDFRNPLPPSPTPPQSETTSSLPASTPQLDAPPEPHPVFENPADATVDTTPEPQAEAGKARAETSEAGAETSDEPIGAIAAPVPESHAPN